MHSAVESVSPTRVRLTVEVPFDELKPDLDEAYKRIGRQVKVQGFRPGKVPARILDQRVGRGAVLEEAVQGAIPRLYGEAVRAESLAPLGRPDVDVTEFSDGDKLTFTAEVDIRPAIELPPLDGLAVTVADAEVTEEEVDAQVEELRGTFGSLCPVERAAAEGDYVTLDLVATIDGNNVPGGTATNLSYRVGSGELLDGVDEAVTGAVAGDVRTFDTVLVAGEFEGQTAQVAVTVRSVNERVLPEVNDEWASESAGFSDLAALRADLGARLDRMKHLQQGVEARDAVLASLLTQVEVPLPERVLEAELAWRQQSAADQLERAGQTLESMLEREGKTAEEWEAELREGAEQSLKTQLVLDAIADREELELSDAEISDQLVRRAARAGVEPQRYADALIQGGQLPTLVAEIRRGKALATVLESAAITDASGRPVDLERLRDDMAEAPPELDESGRPFHVHADGTVHYLDES